MPRQRAFYVAMQWYRPEAEKYMFLKKNERLFVEMHPISLELIQASR